MRIIGTFTGDYEFLSNFYKCSIEYNGISYNSSETAFQAQKTLVEDERKYISTLTPAESKKACGKNGLKDFKIKLRSDWEDVKDNIMYEILRDKFTRNPELKEKLLATGENTLIEGNFWHDNYWGNCTCPKCKNMPGRNQLGLTLMKLREEFKN